jgi:exodeoxyribonuclease VII large subunit
MFLNFPFNRIKPKLYFIIMENLRENSQEVISVSEVNKRAKNLLEKEFSSTWIEGEISSFTAHSSGHWYFTIKDEKSSLSCVMFSYDNNKILFEPQVGDNLIINGKISLYSPTGRFQLNVKHIELAGEGALLRAFEQLKFKLEKEGLFDPDNKRQLPQMPKKIGIVTSSDGAVFQDVINVLGRRSPNIELILIQTAVQGEKAPPEICSAISKASSIKDIDAIILARGGGSIEDLWAFNNESVARAIHNSDIPIISAVGHETDFTIADFVADLRAPTPSAAAEILSQSYSQLNESLEGYKQLIANAITSLIKREFQELQNLSKRLRHPGDKLRELSQKLDNIETYIKKSMQNHLLSQRNNLNLQSSKLLQQSPVQNLQESKHKLSDLSKSLTFLISQISKEKRSSLLALSSTLEAVSPLAVLNRGYSILTTKRGKVVTSEKEVEVGEELTAKLKEGEIRTKVL